MVSEVEQLSASLQYEREIDDLKAKLHAAQVEAQKQIKELRTKDQAKSRTGIWELQGQLDEARTEIEKLRGEVAGRGERLEWSPLQRFEADQLVLRPCFWTWASPADDP